LAVGLVPLVVPHSATRWKGSISDKMPSLVKLKNNAANLIGNAGKSTSCAEVGRMMMTMAHAIMIDALAAMTVTMTSGIRTNLTDFHLANFLAQGAVTIDCPLSFLGLYSRRTGRYDYKLWQTQ
jgi:hypothetical protein